MAVPAVGSQARGKAGIFGSSINPLQVYLQNQVRFQKRQDELYQDERKRRDDLISDLRKFNPDKVWEPFYEEVNQYVQANVRDFAFEGLNQGAPVSSINRELERKKGEANTLVNKINWLKSQYEDADTELEKNPYYKPDTRSSLNDIFFDGRQARVSSDIKSDQIQSIFDNPDNYNVDAIVVDFMKSVPQKINQHWTEIMTPLGKEYNIQETGTKLGLQYDDQGKVVIDPRTGQPKISMTDDVFTQAMENPYLQRIVDKYVPDQNVAKQKNFLQGIMEGLDPTSVKNRPQLGFKLTKEDKWTSGGFSGRVNPEIVKERFNMVKPIVNGFRPDLLATTFSPYEDQDVYYIDATGNRVERTEGGKFYNVNDKVVGTPVKVRFEHKNKIDPNYESNIRRDTGLSAEDKKELISEYRRLNGASVKDFDITRESGRRQLHEAINRTLDQYLAAKDRYGEDYNKVVRDEYEKKSGGVYKTKKEAGGVY